MAKEISSDVFFRKMLSESDRSSHQDDYNSEIEINRINSVVKTFDASQKEKNILFYNMEELDDTIDKKLSEIETYTHGWKLFAKNIKAKYTKLITSKVLDFTEKIYLTRTKQEKILKANLDSAWSDVEDSVSYITDLSKDFISNVWDDLFAIGKLAGSMSKCFLDFVLGPFKAGWNAIDGFLTALSPEVWSKIKLVTKTIASAVSWLWDVGKKAISFVWDGITTIFKVGYTVISNAAKILYKGVKGLFSWWFGMLLNTLFNPLMLIINLPIFLGITSALFIALGSVTSFIIDMSKPLFKKIFNLVGNAFDWIWSGIKVFWGWIGTQYDIWLKPYVDKYIISNIKGFFELPVMQKMFYYVKTSFTWIVTSGVSVVNSIWNGIKKVSNYLKNESGYTLLANFINWINHPPFFLDNLPGWKRFSSYLTKKFGWLSGAVTGGVSTTQLRGQLQTLKRKQFETTIEMQTIKSLKLGKTDSEINVDIMENLIPKLTEMLKGSGLSQEDIQNTIKDRIATSKKILERGGVGALKDYEGSLLEQQKLIFQYESTLKNINLLDPNNPDAQKELSNLILRFGKQVRKENIERLTAKDLNFSESATDDVLKRIDFFNKEVSKRSLLIDPKRIKEMIREREELLKSVNVGWDSNDSFLFNVTRNYAIFGQTLENLVNVGKSRETLEDVVRKDSARLDPSAEIVQQAFISANRTALKPHADGGMKIPELPTTIPLNNKSIEYVREKIKNIKKPDYNETKSKNKEQTNITIIEEHHNYSESYEIYTMSNIARGLLLGG